MTVLGDVLKFAGEAEKITEPADERFVTVRLNGVGAVERKIGAGKTPVPFTGYRVRPGQFIYSRIDARNGAFAIVPDHLDGAVVSKDFPIFEIRETRVFPNFLRHFFRSGRLEQVIRARSRGATNRQRIKEDEFLGFPIEVPGLPEQRRIAAILDQAEGLRAKRSRVLAHLDSLTRSIFNSMFGTEEGRVTLGELADWRSGGTPPRGEARYFRGDIPWFSSGELGSLYVTESRERISREALTSTSVKPVAAGSILVGMYDTAALKSSITTTEATCNQAIAFAQLDDSVDSFFVYFAIQDARDRVLALRRGIRQKNLNLSMIRSMAIPRASLVLQRRFGERVERINSQRTAVQCAGAAEEELFACLQARAFRGEL